MNKFNKIRFTNLAVLFYAHFFLPYMNTCRGDLKWHLDAITNKKHLSFKSG